MHRLLASTPTLEPGSADPLWDSVLAIGLAHQRSQAKQRAKRRAGTLKHIRRLQEKIRRTQSDAAKARSQHALRRQQGKLQALNHKDRRDRDAQAEHEAQMAAAVVSCRRTLPPGATPAVALTAQDVGSVIFVMGWCGVQGFAAFPRPAAAIWASCSA